LERFWLHLGECSPRLKANIEGLWDAPQFVSSDQTLEALFEGIDQAALNFSPIFKVAAELFIHLAVPFADSTVCESEFGTLSSISDGEGMGTGERTENLSNKESLANLLFRRDGRYCLLTGVLFSEDDFHPGLMHLIPVSVRDKPDTLEKIALIAGSATKDIVLQYLDSHQNALHLELNTCVAFDRLRWGIEAQMDSNGTVRYLYRRLPYSPKPGPAHILLRDGDEIQFGEGPKGSDLGQGPLAWLCNLRLGMARAVQLSGAEGVIYQMRDDADDSHLPSHIFIASNDLCDILAAKLLLSSASAIIA